MTDNNCICKECSLFVTDDCPRIIGNDVWISVKDRLPESSIDVLVFDKEAEVCHAKYEVWSKKDKYFCAPHYGQEIEWRFEKVTHWMPLPKPPETE